MTFLSAKIVGIELTFQRNGMMVFALAISGERINEMAALAFDSPTKERTIICLRLSTSILLGRLKVN